MIFFFRPQLWEPGDCPEIQPESAEISCISYLRTTKKIKEQKNYILKFHYVIFCCFLFGPFFFSSWPHVFHSLTREYAAVCERAGVLAITGSLDEEQIQPHSYSGLSEQATCLSDLETA